MCELRQRFLSPQPVTSADMRVTTDDVVLISQPDNQDHIKCGRSLDE